MGVVIDSVIVGSVASTVVGTDATVIETEGFLRTLDFFFGLISVATVATVAPVVKDGSGGATGSFTIGSLRTFF